MNDADEKQSEQGVFLTLSDSTDLVMHNGKLVSVSHMLADKEKTSPDMAKVRYHDKIDAPTPSMPGHFTLSLRASMFYVLSDLLVKEDPGGGNKEILQTHLGGAVPYGIWSTVCTDLIWIVKWSAKGLQPVRPIISVTSQFEVPAGQALLLRRTPNMKSE